MRISRCESRISSNLWKYTVGSKSVNYREPEITMSKDSPAAVPCRSRGRTKISPRESVLSSVQPETMKKRVPAFKDTSAPLPPQNSGLLYLDPSKRLRYQGMGQEEVRSTRTVMRKERRKEGSLEGRAGVGRVRSPGRR